MEIVWLAIVITLPVLAYRGILFRGAWATGIALGLFAFFIFGSMTASTFVGSNDIKGSLQIADAISVLGSGIGFGSLLATCIYRSKRAVAAKA